MNNREWAEEHGYTHYTCRKHGGFWSDGAPRCEQCGPELRECKACKGEFDVDKMIRLRGKWYCDLCVVTCPGCGELALLAEMVEHAGTRICAECGEEQ